MTKKETVQIMALLSAFYGAGKGYPEGMAEGWHLILEPYDFQLAKMAVLNYAENDTREYGTFPTVGNIVKCIKEEIKKQKAPISEIVRAVAYGWSYGQLSENARNNISEDHYNEWLNMDAEEFANRASALAGTLRGEQKRLESRNA